jgi:phosphoglycolate phosphatase-like HAD superfamily hydrolase
VLAARANGIRAVAVGTGIVSLDELQSHAPHVAVPDLRQLAIETLL